MKKTIAIILILCFALTIGYPVFAVDEDESVLNSIQILVEEYFAEREKLLKGESSNLEELVILPVLQDESRHREEINSYPDAITYNVISVVDAEYYYEIQAEECWTGIGLFLHKIIVSDYSDGVFRVHVDEYQDLSGYSSASYLDHPIQRTEQPDEQMRSSLPHIVRIARSQIGYLEKATDDDLDSFTANQGSGNFTKYGEWYGANGVEWCGIFVSWCAGMDGVSQTVFPKFKSCTIGQTNFENLGVYHDASNYTPVAGDIAFFSWGHVGMVSAVDNNGTKTIVEGNYSNSVAEREYSATYTSIDGYAHPNYPSTNHVYNSSSYSYNATHHWKTCVCNHPGPFAAHTFLYTGNDYFCPYCGYTTTNPQAFDPIEDEPY